MHDHCPKDQHNHRHLPEYTESKLSLIKHLGNIPKCLQIKHSVQRVDRTSCLDIIMVIHENRTVSFGRYICLHKQAVVRLKAVACIKLIFFLVRKPEHTVAAKSSCFQIGCNLLHSMILQHIILGRHI